VSRSPESPPAATLESVEAKLAYADATREIRVRALGSGEEHILAGRWMMETPERPDHQVRFRWPTWSPDGNRIAVEGLSGLVYLQWQPDGAGLLHLTATGDGRLRLARAGSSTSIVEGAPLFLSALAGGRVAAHVFAGAPARARLLLLSAAEGEASCLTDRPGGFRAPCLLPGERSFSRFGRRITTEWRSGVRSGATRSSR
jgi:hypothetical protein